MAEVGLPELEVEEPEPQEAPVADRRGGTKRKTQHVLLVDDEETGATKDNGLNTNAEIRAAAVRRSSEAGCAEPDDTSWVRGHMLVSCSERVTHSSPAVAASASALWESSVD